MDDGIKNNYFVFNSEWTNTEVNFSVTKSQESDLNEKINLKTCQINK